MARTIKIDNALLKQFSHRNVKKEKQELRVYFLIVCEGEKTEPNYFKSFPRKIGKIVYDIQYDGGGINTLKVVEKAIELRDQSSQKYDRVWAVFDKDSFEPDQFNRAILKAKKQGISCAWSNEAFELWYLLHFYNRETPMSRNEYKRSIEKAINEKIGNKKKTFKYAKNIPDMYAMLEKYGNREQAIKWAKSLIQQYDGEQFANYNPATMVYKLVEELIDKSDELKKEINEKYLKGE
jgi:hypothetical protein